MLRVGLTGGLASGKSFVGHALAELGCHLIEADKLGHEVMLPGAEAYDAIVREFGAGVLDPDGRIDRRKLSALVWDHPERLEKLNSFVHPAGPRRAKNAVSPKSPRPTRTPSQLWRRPFWLKLVVIRVSTS